MSDCYWVLTLVDEGVGIRTVQICAVLVIGASKLMKEAASVIVTSQNRSSKRGFKPFEYENIFVDLKGFKNLQIKAKSSTTTIIFSV